MAYRDTKYASDIQKDYNNASKKNESAYKNALSNANKALDTQSKKVDDAYSDINKKAQERRTLNAFLNSNDATGSRGVTGTSRLSETVNYENMRNDNADAREYEKEQISRAAIDLGLTNDVNVANMYANNILAKIDADANERQFGYEYDFEEENEAMNEALARTQEFGKVMTKNDAKLLGVPVGTSIRKVTASGGSSSGSRSSGSSSSGVNYSAAAQAVASDSSKLNKLKQLYYAGMQTGSGSKGSTSSNQTSYYQAYLNQLNNTNYGVLGDDSARQYLNSLGVTDKGEQSALMAAAGISEYEKYYADDASTQKLLAITGTGNYGG